MIRIERRFSGPPVSPEQLRQFMDVLAEYYALDESRRRQHRSPARDYWMKHAHRTRMLLLEVFHGKCEYCERTIHASDVEIEHFRPLTGASDLAGSGSPDHYGWLAFEMENTFNACKHCNRAKRGFFPVRGERGKPFTPIAALRETERALLLDPGYDEPAEHLRFVESGEVQALSERGEITIKCLNLNRPELVDDRAEVWREAAAAMAGLVAGRRRDRERFQTMTRDDAVHAAVARAVPQHFDHLIAEQARPVPTQSRPTSELIESEATAEDFRLAARPLQSAAFRNFRILRDLVLQFPEPSSGQAPWLMLLGENAVGKSSILQGIALALAGADEAERWTRPHHLLSHGEDEGWVELRFWDNPEPARLEFRRGERGFGGTRGPSAIMLGYGALRYPARSRRRAGGRPEARFTRLGPLVGPVARIPHPAAWLASLVGTDRFDDVGAVLRRVLPVGPDGTMIPGKRIAFEFGGHPRPLSELSAGYQAIVGMAVDIVRMLFERWNSLLDASAIVLIDEIDAHLHPRWKMRIVQSLREAFPAVQFIASTHDPLVLRGLRNGEVALLRRYPLESFESGEDEVSVAARAEEEEPHVEVEQDLPPIEGLPVDQLLTSRHFGLSSTLDPELEAQFNEYYHLQSLPETPSRRTRIEELKALLADKRLLGRDQREQLLLEAADQFIARDSNALGKLERTELKKATLSRLEQIWARSARGEPLQG